MNSIASMNGATGTVQTRPRPSAPRRAVHHRHRQVQQAARRPRRKGNRHRFLRARAVWRQKPLFHHLRPGSAFIRPQGTVDLVEQMGLYSVASLELTAFGQHLQVGQTPLLAPRPNPANCATRLGGRRHRIAGPWLVARTSRAILIGAGTGPAMQQVARVCSKRKMILILRPHRRLRPRMVPRLTTDINSVFSSPVRLLQRQLVTRGRRQNLWGLRRI